MSNHLAIATVTATLDNVLTKAVEKDVPGVLVTTDRPDAAGSGPPTTRVNVFLYQVTPSAAARNEDLPTRSSDGRTTMRRPRIGLDLHYLLTFYGREAGFIPQQLLGSVVRTLHARPVLTRPQIEDAITAFPALARSNLADDIELVKFTQLPLTLEELSKLWSVFFQTAYQLSVAYQGTVVFVDSDDSFASPLPVRLRKVYVETFREPLVEEVVAFAGDDLPILAGSQIRVRGKRLRGAKTRLSIDGSPVPAATVTDSEITAALPALEAGLHALQVEHIRQMGTPLLDHTGVESNVAPFVLTPQITKTGGVYDITAVAVVDPDGAAAHDITIGVDPPVAERQRVVLLLNRPGAATEAYSFPDDPRPAPPNPPSTNLLSIHARKVPAGTYLVRIQVDGADSPLDLTGDTYSGPTVAL
jgi:Pvc16 N-terminal domain/IPT/TIG domain